MGFIEFDCSFHLLYVLVNPIATYCCYEGNRNILSLNISCTLTIIISIYLYHYDKKSATNESLIYKINESTTKENVETKENQIIVTKVKEKLDVSDSIDQIIDKYRIYPIIFLYYFILNIIPFSKSIFSQTIYLSYEYLSNLVMLICFYTLLREKLYRHHAVGLLFIILFSYFHPDHKFEIKTKYLFSFLFYAYYGAIQCFHKIMMVKYYVSPHIISIANASMMMVLDIIRFVTQSYIKKDIIFLSSDYFNLTLMKNTTILSESLMYIIGNSANPIINSLIVYYYPPFVYPVSNYLYSIFVLIPKFALSWENLKKLICIVGIGLGLCILSELIIFNFAGMGFNAKLNIKRRAEKEGMIDCYSSSSQSSNSSMNSSYGFK